MFLFCTIQGSPTPTDDATIEAASDNVAAGREGRAVSCTRNGVCTERSRQVCRTLSNGQRECVWVGK